MTLEEALKLEVNKRLRLVTDIKDFSRNVKKVGILDHEVGETIINDFEKGEFVLSTLLIIKDKPEQMLGFVKALIQAETACFALKTIYFKEFPQEVIDYANEHDFPLFLFDVTFFEDIITELNNSIKKENDELVIQYKVDQLLSGDYNRFRVRNIAYDINNSFFEKHIVVTCMPKQSGQKNFLGKIGARDTYLSDWHKMFYYHGKVMVILSFEDEGIIINEGLINSFLHSSGIDESSYYIGVGKVHKTLEELDISINESLYALTYATVEKPGMAWFDNMGLYRALIPQIGSPWVQEYYDSIIKPLIRFDRENDSKLVKTAIEYIRNGGDIKATANSMFQHPNTIRYRMEKIKTLLSTVVNEASFYEELSVVVRIHLIFTESL